MGTGSDDELGVQPAMARPAARVGGSKRDQSGDEEKQFAPVAQKEPGFQRMAVEVEGLAGGERVHADGGIIKVVTYVEFSFSHGTEHVGQAAHRVQSAAA